MFSLVNCDNNPKSLLVPPPQNYMAHIDESGPSKPLGSQDDSTPPAGSFTEPQLAVPSTAIIGKKVKKHRKRKNKSNKAASQQAPKTMRVQDEPERYNDAPRVYVPGTPMLSATLLKTTSGDIRSLHDRIVFLEKTRMQN